MDVKRELDSLVTQMHSSGIRYEDAVREFKKQFLREVLVAHRGNQCKAAEELGMHRNTLSRPWRNSDSIWQKYVPDSSVRPVANVLCIAHAPELSIRLTVPESMQTIQTHEARVAIEPGFAWDGQDAYLFDIDGTLLRTRDRIHVDSFASSVQRVTGFEITLSGILLHGSTDTAILREACKQAGIPAEVLEAHVEAVLEAMCSTVEKRRHEFDLVRMPGVEEMLRHLAKRGALLGVGTGNLEMIGWTKVEEAGLREWFRFGGFSDHFPVRSELIGHAAGKARELAGSGSQHLRSW